MFLFVFLIQTLLTLRVGFPSEERIQKIVDFTHDLFHPLFCLLLSSCVVFSIPCFVGKCKCPEQFVIPSVTVSLYPLQLCEYAGQVIEGLFRATDLLVDLTVFGIQQTVNNRWLAVEDSLIQLLHGNRCEKGRIEHPQNLHLHLRKRFVQ